MPTLDAALSFIGTIAVVMGIVTYLVHVTFPDTPKEK